MKIPIRDGRPAPPGPRKNRPAKRRCYPTPQKRKKSARDLHHRPFAKHYMSLQLPMTICVLCQFFYTLFAPPRGFSPLPCPALRKYGPPRSSLFQIEIFCQFHFLSNIWYELKPHLSSTTILTRFSWYSDRLAEGCDKVRGPVEQNLGKNGSKYFRISR